MKVDIIPIGNSRGIRIPKALLEQCGFGESVEIEVEYKHLVLSPTRQLRSGWEDAFKEMAAAQDDKLREMGRPLLMRASGNGESQKIRRVSGFARSDGRF